MTTKEKAKAYNKAIQKVKDYYNEKTKINPELSKVLELIFPELKKSEDEKIKEEIIDFLNLPHPQFVGKRDYKDWIAWLEKQGKQKPTWSEYDDKMMYYTNEFLKYHENSDPTATSCIIWLKSLKPHNNNIESKFKVGDWVVDKQGKVNQITSATDDGYGFCLYDGTYVNGCWKDYYHRWTIQDAKNGDILVNGSNIFIFHYIYDKRIMGYCHVNIDNGRFYDDTNKIECFCLIDDIVKPATKKQYDSLIKAITEAGYEWDNEKKELKNTEHSNEESNKEDDEYMYKSIIDVLTNNTVLGSKGREIYSKEIEWLKSLRDTKILVEKDDKMDGLFHAKIILEKTLGKVEGYQTDDGILEHKSAINAVKKLYNMNS